MVAGVRREKQAAVPQGRCMLPNIRAVIAAVVTAIGLLVVAAGVIATLRVAQESRAGSLQADLAQRGHAVMPEPQAIVLIETPGPTLLARAPEIEPLSAAALQTAPSAEPPAIEREQATQPVVTVPASPPVVAVSADPDQDDTRTAPAPPAAPESMPVAATEPAAGPPAATAVVATAPQEIEPQPEPSSPPPILAVGGPSPEEIARAKAQRKVAERARARKAAEEKRKKARAARIARERKLAAQRAADAQKQQASASGQPNGFGFTSAGPFNSAPFGNSFDFGSATNRR